MLDPARHRLTALLLASVVTGAAYWLAGLGGLELALVRGQVSPLWPASGVALFCLVQFGWRAVPGILIGAVLVNVAFGPSAIAVLVIACGNTAAPVAAWLLLRQVGFRPDLSRTTDAAALIGLGGLAGMTVSASVGSGSLVLFDALPATEFWPTWTVWWAGDAMGVLIVAPVLLILKAPRPDWLRSQARWAEAIVVLATSVGITVLGIASPIDVMFPCFVPLVWAAVRLQQFGAAPCALVISVITTAAAATGTGPFTGYDLIQTMIVLHAFNGSVALVALLVSAAINERNQAQAAVEETCSVLSDAVSKLSGETGLGERTLAAVRRAANGHEATAEPEPVEPGVPQ